MSGIANGRDAERPLILATASEVFGTDDVAVALGRSNGIHRMTGNPMDAHFAQIWRLAGGKIVGFKQYIDTPDVACDAIVLTAAVFARRGGPHI